MSFLDKILPLAGAGVGFALGGPAGAGLGLSLGSGISNITRGFPQFPLTEADVNRIIDQQMNRTLADVASGTRRRLIGAGQEGSGAINAAITDAQSRVRNIFEEQRTKALQLLKQAQFQRDVSSFNQLGQTLGDLSSIGFSAFQLGQGSNQQLPNVPAQLGDFLNLLGSGTLGPQQASFLSQPVQSLQPRGLSPLQGPRFNVPLQGV